ncbi:MAG: sulfotransferase [Rhodobacteraceae bacterium]|nr:sulfotransferase [Paracoccaceae bacterium]
MHPDPTEQAFALLQAGQFDRAQALLEAVLQNDPRNARARYGLGVACLSFGRTAQAIPHLEEAAKGAKKEAVVHTTLASALNIEKRSEDALPHARKGASLAPGSEYAQRVLGEVYADLRRSGLARQAFEQALKADPQSPRAHLGLFELEMTLGNRELAENHIRTAFTEAPSDPAILTAAAEAQDETLKASVLEGIERHLSNLPQGAATAEVTRLAFAAGKICDAAGDTGKAFSFFDGYRTGLYPAHDPGVQKAFVESCKAAFDREFFEQRKDWALSSDRPVFVFGMPRSGTTLVERIIGRHPAARAAGELQFIPDRIHDLASGRIHGPHLFETARQMTRQDAQRIGRRYLSYLEDIDKRAHRVIDKMPHNYENLWLLALLFPNSSFVHVTRSAEDTCLSIYMTPLPPHHSYNESQASLGRYFNLYRDLMAHWSEVLPVALRHQSYESLVSDNETESRALLAHTGLDWDDDCLKPPDETTQIFTFSREQARRPVYGSSVGRWKAYQAHIQPLLAALEAKAN